MGHVLLTALCATCDVAGGGSICQPNCERRLVDSLDLSSLQFNSLDDHSMLVSPGYVHGCLLEGYSVPLMQAMPTIGRLKVNQSFSSHATPAIGCLMVNQSCSVHAMSTLCSQLSAWWSCNPAQSMLCPRLSARRLLSPVQFRLCPQLST